MHYEDWNGAENICSVCGFCAILRSEFSRKRKCLLKFVYFNDKMFMYLVRRMVYMIKFDCLWELMKEKNITKTQLRTAAGLSTSTFAKLTKNEMVSLNVLVRLCKVLECQLSDICTIDFGEKV